MSRKRLLFRADGNPKIGYGHMSRCMALAELMSDTFDIAFAVQQPDDALLNNLRRITTDVYTLPVRDRLDPDYTAEFKSCVSSDDTVVLDGYAFDTTYEAELKALAAAVISIDDIPQRHFVSDAVINFCGAISRDRYAKEFYTQLFLGASYLFLRSPFLRGSSITKEFGNRLLLNMGGADPDNATAGILEQLVKSGYAGPIDIIIGSSYPHRRSLEAIARGQSVTILQALDAAQMHNIMRQCSIAVLPPSTVAWEFLSTGGLLFLHQTADNQACIRKYLVEKELAFDFAAFEKRQGDAEAFVEMSRKQRQILDGSSLLRIKKEISAISVAAGLRFRKAANADAKQCFDWASDPEVRKYSYSTAPIVWENHIEWFGKKIADANTFYYIAEIENQPVGQIRFDLSREEDGFVISYTIGKDWRGKGLGTYMLTKGLLALKRSRDVKKVVGYVQNFNVASLRSFERAGFTMTPTSKYTDSVKFEISF